MPDRGSVMERKFAILVVDDNVRLTSNLRDVLEVEGYDTGVTQDGQGTLALCRQRAFDLALIDIKLPDISGIKLIEKLAKLFPGMEYIISTGYASLETAAAAVGRRDIVAYVTKPLDMEHLLALVRQVSERKQAETALKRSSEFFKTIFNSTDDAISIINVPDFTIAGANDAFRQRYGLEDAEASEKTCYQITHHRSEPCTPPDDICPLLSTVTTGEHSATEHTHYTADGEKIYVEVATSPIRDENGKVIQVVHVARDITERKEMQFQLLQMEKLSTVGTMAAGIAHELLNPMMGILNFARYCRERTTEDDRRHAVLKDIERETERCVDIVKNLLTFYHIGRQGEEEYQRESLATIIDRVVRLLSYRIEQQGVSLTQHIAEGTPEVWMETSSLQQVFLNLISNALDAVEESEKREVRVKVRGDGKFVQATIADSGGGIPPENLEKIFTPFFTTKPAGQGTGLGLALSQSIILKHGGDITCQSNPGVGTTFKVLLPVGTRGGAQ